MKMKKTILTLLSIVCLGVMGCGGESTQTSTPTEPTSSGSSTSHAPHVHGPNGGHAFAFEGGELQAEWKSYSDNNFIRMYILDSTGKKNVPTKVDSFTVKRISGDDKVFELKAEEPDDNGEAVVYSLEDESLTKAMFLGVKVEMKVGDKTYTGEIPAHTPHH